MRYAASSQCVGKSPAAAGAVQQRLLPGGIGRLAVDRRIDVGRIGAGSIMIRGVTDAGEIQIGTIACGRLAPGRRSVARVGLNQHCGIHVRAMQPDQRHAHHAVPCIRGIRRAAGEVPIALRARAHACPRRLIMPRYSSDACLGAPCACAAMRRTGKWLGTGRSSAAPTVTSAMNPSDARQFRMHRSVAERAGAVRHIPRYRLSANARA